MPTKAYFKIMMMMIIIIIIMNSEGLGIVPGP